MEIEVYRLTPEVGKFYKTVKYTTKTGSLSQGNERYFSSATPRYVGKFMRGVTHNFGDNITHYYVFELNGKSVVIHSTYEGTTSFIECEAEP